MAGNKIPLLSHLKASLTRALLLISEVAEATAEALTEMQGNLDDKMDESVYNPAGTKEQVAFQSQLQEIQDLLYTGELSVLLLDSDGNALTTSAGEMLAANWKYQRE